MCVAALAGSSIALAAAGGNGRQKVSASSREVAGIGEVALLLPSKAGKGEWCLASLHGDWMPGWGPIRVARSKHGWSCGDTRESLALEFAWSIIEVAGDHT